MRDTTSGRCPRLLIGVLLGALTLIGLTAGPAAATDPPTIDEVTISPTTFSGSPGQTVTVRARILSQSGGLQSASAYIDPGPTGTFNGGDMQQESPGSAYWSATIGVPPNNSGDPLTYQVSIIALGLASEVTNQIVGTIGQLVRDDPPVVSTFRVSPASLSSAGGPVTVYAEVVDDHGLSDVHADVAMPGGGSTRVALTEVSFATYVGTFEAPANPGLRAKRYVAALTVVDTAGQAPASTYSKNINVASRAVTVSVSQLDVGDVVVGQTGSVDLALTNNTAADLSVTLSLSPHKPFTFVTTDDHLVTFVLGAGETRAVGIVFAPTQRGIRRSPVRIDPAARGRVRFSLPVTGTGVRPPA